MVGTANGASGAYVPRHVVEAHRHEAASVTNQDLKLAGKNAMYLDQARKSKNVTHRVALTRKYKMFFYRRDV